MREAVSLITRCKNISSTCTLPEIKDKIQQQCELMENKLNGWEEKNKKIWKDIIPKRYAQPETINQDFSIPFAEVMKE